MTQPPTQSEIEQEMEEFHQKEMEFGRPEEDL